MTGLLAHNHGVLQVEHCVDNDQSVLRVDRPHWAQRLVEAGYQTAYFGKWHIERTHQLEDFGWQVNCSYKNQSYQQAGRAVKEPEADQLDSSLTRYLIGPEGYGPKLHYAVTDIPVEERGVSMPARQAQKFLAKALHQDQPWCCCVSFSEPNESMICSRETFDLYNVDAIDLPPNLDDKLTGCPAIYRRTQQIFKDMTPHQWQEARTCYYARITEVDQQLGKLLKQIELADQLDHTIIVVASDHGRYVGSHGMESHNFGAFEEIYNIPLLVSGPGIAKGVCSEARVGLHDLCPTLLELADAVPINVPDSRSFAAVLRDPSGSKKSFRTGYAEYHGTRFPLMQRIFWDGSWKLVFIGFDFDELYNLDQDPYEMNNLVNDPAHSSRLHKMMKEIWRRVRDTNDRTLRDTQYYPMRFAPVGPEIGKTSEGIEI